MEMRRKLVMRMRMLGARERAVRRRRSWTEKATSCPVARVPHPEVDEGHEGHGRGQARTSAARWTRRSSTCALEAGADGRKVCIADAGDFDGRAVGAVAACAAARCGEDERSHGRATVSRAIYTRLLSWRPSEFPQPLALAGQEVPVPRCFAPASAAACGRRRDGGRP